jgi:hypothetical protein
MRMNHSNPRAIPDVLSRVHILLVGAVAVVLACSRADHLPVEHAAVPEPKAASLEINVDSSNLYPNVRRIVGITAADSDGMRMSLAGAEVTISDSMVAVIDTVMLTTIQNYPNEPSYDQMSAVVRFVTAGAVTLHVAFEKISRDIPFSVQPLPLPTSALVVDSFTVLEHPFCERGCSMLYEPILRVREPGGLSPVTVVGVDIELPTLGTTLCTGSMTIEAGQSTDVIYYTDDPDAYWGDSFLMQNFPGDPIPDGPAIARLIVRTSQGAYGLVEASGTIQRMVPSPSLPVTDDLQLLIWRCT